MRCLLLGLLGFLCLADATSAKPPDDTSPPSAKISAVILPATPCISEISFIGLRHISSAALEAQLSSRTGAPLNARNVESDVRTLARLGWFETIRVETLASTASPLQSPGERIALIFYFTELPFLSSLKFSGSLLLSEKQIEKLLTEKKLAPGFGKPADPAALQQIAFSIRSALNELGHPDATVRIERLQAANATVAVRFQVDDGPPLRVHRVGFEGNPQFSTKLLHRQMRNIAPWQPFASLRAKDVYTHEVFEEDRQRILSYYQNHGYPEVRIDNPQLTRVIEPSNRWRHRSHAPAHSALSISIPVQAGPFYRLQSISISQALQHAADERRNKPVNLPAPVHDNPYSAEHVEKMRRWWLAQLQPRDSKSDSAPFRSVAARQSFDAEKHAAHIELDLGDSPPYIVHRIEFLGLHKFSDRYMRHRIPLQEGRPVDDRALQAGLARLARTGYFKPIHREDIHVQMDEATRTAHISIRVEEIGQQRASLIGGHGQFGSTLGIAYTVFDLLNREELLSTQLEGGPESLDVMLSLAKEGIFGTRASLAFSVFNNVIRPRFTKSVQGPFFTSHGEGINIPWSYPLSNTDSLGVNYTLSRAITDYQVTLAPLPTGVISSDTKTRISSRSLGMAWAHDAGNERAAFSDSFSGGPLGGGENMIRSSAEYGRILHDPIFSASHAWAFRMKLIGGGSYRGDMPFYSRLFPGDELVRGLNPGELGPYALTYKMASSGATTSSAAPAGANLTTGANAEYRIPLGGRTEAAGFFDLGSAWLLPNWLGPVRPLLLNSTNGVLHGSAGIELRWTIPGVQVPVRAYYAVNVLRLDRSFHLSDKSFFFVRNHFSAFGWGLGSLF
ncbi:MAG TPA: POTRA domain-containing protein [Candidatus Acidoferrum sp.]